MSLSWYEIRNNAMAFSKKWQDATNEAAEAQLFLNDFFAVFGVDLKRVATFERKVPALQSRNGYIDLLWKGVILVEMKSKGKSLDRAYAQATDYAFHLEDEELPEYIMVCNFEFIRVYHQISGGVWTFPTAQLHKNVKLLPSLAGYKFNSDMPSNREVDVKAAEKMAKLHDILKSHGYEGHQLELYLVRLLFCMFADDTGIFEKNIFFDYISASKADGSDLSARIAWLFEVLDTPPEQLVKQTMLPDELKCFPYINGSLFSEKISFAVYDQKMRKILLECCSLDWGYISPAIFGAMFQGVMNPQERRELGAHYTSEENIMKVIKPLFLDELREEFERVKGNSRQLELFHDKLSRLKFLDPACGCGNFLIITYKEVRLLELEVLKMLYDNLSQLQMIEIKINCKVNVDQFFGIEYEEFPCQIARVGMWLMDHQMNMRVAEHFGTYFARLPLKQAAAIVNGNALRIDWESVVPKHELSFILGNPPFVGFTYMSDEQKEDMKLFTKAKNLDYVCAWYLKAASFIKGTNIQVAFVSTNSITQGEPVSVLWEPMLNDFGIHINYAYRTFVWNNEAKGKAAVHCVIIGFSQFKNSKPKQIFEINQIIIASNINPYLVNAPDILVESTSTPICDVPKIMLGNKPSDGGHLILTEEEKNEILNKEPAASSYIKKYISAEEFINGTHRYCLWLKDADPSWKKCPDVLQRVNKVREMRLASSAAPTREKAETPQLFFFISQPETDYLLIPSTTSEKRLYIPIGMVNKDVIASNASVIVANATLYHFGILTSNVHMAWMRTVAGRLKSDYRYSGSIVYNTFPWPTPTEEQKTAIEVAAQNVLDVRENYQGWSFADLYNTPMEEPLRIAHKSLDKAVWVAYGAKWKSETECVADLMERYSRLVAQM